MDGSWRGSKGKRWVKGEGVDGGVGEGGRGGRGEGVLSLNFRWDMVEFGFIQ